MVKEPFDIAIRGSGHQPNTAIPAARDTPDDINAPPPTPILRERLGQGIAFSHTDGQPRSALIEWYCLHCRRPVIMQRSSRDQMFMRRSAGGAAGVRRVDNEWLGRGARGACDCASWKSFWSNFVTLRRVTVVGLSQHHLLCSAVDAHAIINQFGSSGRLAEARTENHHRHA